MNCQCIMRIRGGGAKLPKVNFEFSSQDAPIPLSIRILKRYKTCFYHNWKCFLWMTSFISWTHRKRQMGKTSICSYLSYMMSDQKNKDTLFSSTFKVEENNVPLFFWSNIILWLLRGFQVSSWIDKITKNSTEWTLIMKISPLLFLQLLKLKKIMCLYFLDQTSFDGDFSFLSFCYLQGVFWYLHEMTKLL